MGTRKDTREGLQRLPMVPIVFARIEVFSAILASLKLDQLTEVETYLVSNYRPEFQKVFTDFMHKNMKGYLPPIIFSKIRGGDNSPEAKLAHAMDKNRKSYVVKTSIMDATINLN